MTKITALSVSSSSSSPISPIARIETGDRGGPATPVGHGRAASAATRILEILRAEPTVLREDIARRTDLSPATVTRTTSALIAAGLVGQRYDCSVLGRMGRPAIPLSLMEDRHVCVGVHIGREAITIAAGDLRGRILAYALIHHADSSTPLIELISHAVGQLLNGFLDRELLAAGLVAPWRALGLSSVRVARKLRASLGLPVAVGDHVQAIVAAEVSRRPPPPGLSCYVYARNVPGFALVVNDGTETEVSAVADLTHFPTESRYPCSCGRRGCFEASIGERGVVARAVEAGTIARPVMADLEAAAHGGNRQAIDVLEERATLLGRAAGLVRDLYAPDRMIFLGQAFEGIPETRGTLRESFDKATALGPIDMVIPERGTDNVQAAAACFVALEPIYEDPFSSLGDRAVDDTARSTTLRSR